MRWRRPILSVLSGAVLIHVVVIWALPRGIVRVVHRRLAAAVGMNHIHHAPLPDSEWRTIVMPSPDLLYSACAYDVSDRPLLVTAETPDGYWSVSAFAENTDNFFVQNDRMASDHRVRVVFSSQPHFRDPGGGTVVQVPSKTGVIIFRQLVLSRDDLPKAQVIQRAATCAPL